MIEPNCYLRFKTELGTETDIDCHVKISGPICIWIGDHIGEYIDGELVMKKIFIPSQEKITKYPWFKELVRKYGKYQGIFQTTNTVVVPGEEEKHNKPAW